MLEPDLGVGVGVGAGAGAQAAAEEAPVPAAEARFEEPQVQWPQAPSAPENPSAGELL